MEIFTTIFTVYKIVTVYREAIYYNLKQLKYWYWKKKECNGSHILGFFGRTVFTQVTSRNKYMQKSVIKKEEKLKVR